MRPAVSRSSPSSPSSRLPRDVGQSSSSRALVASNGSQYDHLLVLRLDTLLRGLRLCVQHSVGLSTSQVLSGDGGPQSSEALATCSKDCNHVYGRLSEMTVAADRFHYIPGNLLRCYLKHRDYLAGHGWAHQYAMLTAWSGSTSETSASVSSTWHSCVQPLGYEKHTADGCAAAAHIRTTPPND